MILDDEDERLWFKANGRFEAEVVPQREDEDEEAAAPEAEWRRLNGPDELVEFYDPTDVFGDFAEALAEAFPAIAGDADEDEEADEDDADADEDQETDDEDVEDVEDVEDDEDVDAKGEDPARS
jgi:hypothetical protein